MTKYITSKKNAEQRLGKTKNKVFFTPVFLDVIFGLEILSTDMTLLT